MNRKKPYNKFGIRPLREVLDETERNVVFSAIYQTGSVERAAKALGIGATIYRRLRMWDESHLIRDFVKSGKYAGKNRQK
jgi:hypothetical protein